MGCSTWLIEESKKKGKYQGGNKAMAYMLKKQGEIGWLRRLEARLTGRVVLARKPNDDEKNLALKLYLSLLSCEGAAKLIACAWGVKRQTIYN
jgi:DNA invertase Pin-like site-specific DNA recombinase